MLRSLRGPLLSLAVAAIGLSAAGRAGAEPPWTPTGEYVLQVRVGSAKAVGSLSVAPGVSGYQVFRTATTNGTASTLVGRGTLSGATLKVSFGLPGREGWEDPAAGVDAGGAITATYVFDAKGKLFGRLVNPRRVGGWGAANDAGQRTLTALTHPNPYSEEFARDGLGPDFQVERGQLSFDAEGTEGGPYHSRRAHLPPGNSGVTIGRGFDLGQHTNRQIRAALLAAGLSESDVRKFAEAAGKRGSAARAWLRENAGRLRELTPAQQKKLFELTYAEMEADVARLSDNAAFDAKLAQPDPNETDAAMLDLLVDMRYRGDYTGRTRRRLETAVAEGDLVGVCEIVTDRNHWSNVPKDRYRRRVAYLCEREAVVDGEGRPETPASTRPGR
ncbi:MAG: hypothetical protein HYZ53_29005 [Planctomycetes bacterium]|nr:hypothetical protein [Planctomycetota bacterium]